MKIVPDNMPYHAYLSMQMAEAESNGIKIKKLILTEEEVAIIQKEMEDMMHIVSNCESPVEPFMFNGYQFIKE